MAAPLSERVVATEVEIKALNNKVTELEGDVKKLLNTHYWVMGAAAGAGFVLAIFADYIKKHMGL
jgi:hypothetical protein